jgi:hypothetical protein
LVSPWTNRQALVLHFFSSPLGIDAYINGDAAIYYSEHGAGCNRDTFMASMLLSSSDIIMLILVNHQNKGFLSLVFMTLGAQCGDGM